MNETSQLRELLKKNLFTEIESHPNRDTFFLNSVSDQLPFSFSKHVVDVFDDMVSRSVPCYLDILKLIVAAVKLEVPRGGTVYDFGCSTGNVLISIQYYLHQHQLNLIGFDQSADMLDAARKKIEVYELKDITLSQVDLNQSFQMRTCDAVILNLTLQFLALESRQCVLKFIYKHLKPGGTLIVVEKIVDDHAGFNQSMSMRYEQLKMFNGYSQNEIENKKKALAGILIPLSISQNELMFESAGFRRVRRQFQWCNFVGWEIKK
jgi:tRNA (cmo5U34)-methyltransferase